MKKFLRRKERSKGKNTWLKALIVGVLIVLVSIAGWSLWDIWQEYNLPAEEIVVKAVEKTLEYENYQFTATAWRESQGRREQICTVRGEINGENSHLAGTIDLVDSEFEIYQIGDNYYRRDGVDGKWLVIDNLGRQAVQSLIAEIDPLAMLRFSTPFEAEYLGKEIIDGSKYRKFQVLNYVTDEYLTYSWQDILLTLWVDKKGYIKRAQIVAGEKDAPERKLNLSVDFGLDKQVELIEAPI